MKLTYRVSVNQPIKVILNIKNRKIEINVILPNNP
jgi:hypothetical protein